MRDLIYRETARRIIDSPRSKSQMLTVLKCTPSVQPDSCEGCKWEDGYGYYGECSRCKRAHDDMYEQKEGEADGRPDKQK